MKRSGIFLVALMSATVLAGGCAGKPAEKTQLIVSAAASLTECMRVIKTDYEAKRPDVEIVYNFGSSGSLAQQIEQGAPADLFFSAGKKQVESLTGKGMLDAASVRDVLENSLVTVIPEGGGQFTFETLKNAEKIGVGDPASVPAGLYAAEVFEQMGIASELDGKLVYAKDVREVLSWVETGNVDVGLVYKTDALIGNVTVCADAPVGSHSPIVYPAGVVADSKNAKDATDFLDYLCSGAARESYTKFGFTPVY